jgi:hypothetical protein
LKRGEFLTSGAFFGDQSQEYDCGDIPLFGFSRGFKRGIPIFPDAY